MIIDFHTHIFPPRMKKERTRYLGRDPLFATLYSNPKAKLATAEELIESMDRADVEVSVILNGGWSSHELCVETNDYILEAVARYPQRLIGFCAVQPRAGEAAWREMERCARGGARGIGEMSPDAQGFDFGDRETMAPFVELARRYGLIFLTHASEPVGHSYPGKGTITPDLLYRFISNFPDFPLVCAHWGGGLPFYALMPEVAESFGNVFFDSAATPFLYRAEIFKYVAEIAGVDKILFGSDYPLIAQDRVIRSIQALQLPQGAEGLILGGNAERILQRGTRGPGSSGAVGGL